MAIEIKRGCGYRKVGGLYLVGGCPSVPCDRIPFPVGACPVCGEGIHFTRSYKAINPFKLFGSHDFILPNGIEGVISKNLCIDPYRPCFLCDPKEELAFLMTIGVKAYPTPADYMNEARVQGISRRIGAFPKNLEPGKTVVYLTHPRAVEVQSIDEVINGRLALWEEKEASTGKFITTGTLTKTKEKKSDKPKYQLGIITAFIPQRVEKLFWKSELTDEVREDCAKRNITPVEIPDGDTDHA